MKKYIVVYHNEKTTFSSNDYPKMDLNQLVKEFDSYEEAMSCFRWAITETPYYTCDFKNPPEDIEKLNAANQLILKFQRDSQYVPTDEEIVECEISEDNGRGAYCCVTPEIITLANTGIFSMEYLSTNAHSSSDSELKHFVLKTSYEDILNAETIIETCCVTITPVE